MQVFVPRLITIHPFLIALDQVMHVLTWGKKQQILMSTGFKPAKMCDTEPSRA